MPPAPTTSRAQSHGAFKKTLTFKDLLAYGLAYIAPVAPLSTIGFVWNASGGLIACAYLLGALCMYFTAQSYANMSEVAPNAGSVYGFASFTLGPLAGFMAGWMILLDYLLVPALVYVLMSIGIGTLIPELDRATWICILVGTSVLINWFGVTVTTRISIFSVIAQFLIVFIVIGLAMYALLHGFGNGGLTHKPFIENWPPDFGKIFAGTSIAVLSFIGFDAISTLAEEVKSSDRRLIGRAILGVLAISGTLFMVTTWVLGDLMPAIQIQDPATAIFELLTQTVGVWASIALAWAMALIVGFTNALPMQVGVSRVLFAMGRDRQLPHALGRIHHKHGTPHIAMLVSTAISLAVGLSLRNEVDLLASLVNFGALISFMLLHISVLVHFGMNKSKRQWFSHIAVPIVGIMVVLVVLEGMHTVALQVGLAWLIFGLGYGLYLKRRGRVILDVS